ncbi:MAG: DUF2617 family protein [Planctomycetaceae bacterium]|nr:MAG: DUF2617 family protein [Planctomycetaceae bacterium]
MRIGQKQCVSQMRFLIYNRSLHPELFDIYQDEHIVKSAYEARIWITGCTHVISFYRGKHAMVELMAAPAADLPQHGMLLELPLRGEHNHERRRIDGINYMMNFQVESMSAAVYSKTHHDLAKLGNKHGLFVPFPLWRANSLTPFSYIDYDAKPNELNVFAFHAFPEDLTIIKTQSIFELG